MRRRLMASVFAVALLSAASGCTGGPVATPAGGPSTTAVPPTVRAACLGFSQWFLLWKMKDSYAGPRWTALMRDLGASTDGELRALGGQWQVTTDGRQYLDDLYAVADRCRHFGLLRPDGTPR